MNRPMRRKLVPYPLRASFLHFGFAPFAFWWKPSFTWRRSLTERAKADGETIWWARWLWFQVSYSRLV